MPVIEGQVVNMITFPGKEGKADRRVIQILETLGKMATLVDVADMCQDRHGIAVGQQVRLPVVDGGYADKFSGAVKVTYTYFGHKNGNGNSGGAAHPPGPDKGGMLGK